MNLKKMTTTGLLALGLVAAPRIVSAQTMQWTDKGYVSVSGGAQGGSHDLGGSSSFPQYDETATVTTTQKIKGGGLFDIGGAYRVWGKNLLAGVSFTHTASKSDVSLTAQIPDPIVFDKLRTVTSSQTGAEHSENAVHLSAIWMIPVANKIDVGIFAGPSIFSVKQDLISGGTLTVGEPGPTVTAPLGRASKTSVGGHIGVDVQYMIAKRYGVGAVLRYAGGSASLAGASKKLTVGGFQIGVGGRVRF